MLSHAVHPVKMQPSEMAVRALDDDEQVLNYLTVTLQSHGIACRGYLDVNSFFSDEQAVPSCVLVDWRLGADDGMAVAERCQKVWPNTAIVLISGHATVALAVSAMRQGLDGVLQKPISPRDLVKEVCDACDRSKARNAEHQSQVDARALLEKLGSREFEILKLLAAGVPNKNIASQLSLAMRTVEKYRRSLFDALGVDSAAEATRILVLAKLDHAP